MTTPPPPVGRALGRLGARLRTVREAAGLSGSELAAALGAGWRQPKISKIETGRQLPAVSEITAWSAVTGVDPWPLVALRTKAAAEYAAHRDRIAGAGGALAHQDDLAELARSCTSLTEYQPALVPGRLQTPAYMREMAAGDEFLAEDGLPVETLGHVIAAKVRRQAILYEPGREIVHVVGEAALRLRIGQMSAATLRGQLAHLIEVATLPGHTFGVVPFAVATPIVPASGWSMYDRVLVRVETVAGVLELTEPDTVARYSRWLDQLLEVALVGEQAAEFCRQVAASLPGDG